MNDSARLRRQLYILRALEKPHTFPSLTKLTERLQDRDFGRVSDATIERDINDIRTEYGLTIIYERRRRGYYLDLPTEADVDEFNQYVRLLERRERLETLTKSGRTGGQYLQLEQHDGFRGLNLLDPIWQALQRQLVLQFRYQPYQGQAGQLRLVEPGLLFEYRNRWYLDGFDMEAGKGHRTFGLDRMNDLSLTATAINPNRTINYRAARQHAIGVTAPPDALVERVVLRVARPEAEYIRSLPLHASQQTLIETTEHIDFQLDVVVNHELKREILAFGHHVEVLEPQHLRAEIAGHIRDLAAKYNY